MANTTPPKRKCTLQTTKTSKFSPILWVKKVENFVKKNHWSRMSETSCSMHKKSTNSHPLESFANLKKFGFHKQQWIWWPQHVFHAQKACLVLKFGRGTPPTPTIGSRWWWYSSVTYWNDDLGSRNPKSCQKAFCYTSWTRVVSTQMRNCFWENNEGVKIKFFGMSPCVWSLVWPFNPSFHPQFWV